MQMVYLSSIYTLHHNGSFRNAKTGFSEADGRVCAGPDKLENTRDYSKLWLVPGCVTPRRALHRRARCPSVPMAAAQTLVFASTVPGPGSASVSANVLGQEDPAMGSKTRIGSSDDAEKSAVAPPPSVPVTNQPSSTATTAPIPRATAVWWQNDAVLRARIDAGSGDALGLVWIKNIKCTVHVDLPDLNGQ